MVTAAGGLVWSVWAKWLSTIAFTGCAARRNAGRVRCRRKRPATGFGRRVRSAGRRGRRPPVGQQQCAEGDLPGRELLADGRRGSAPKSGSAGSCPGRRCCPRCAPTRRGVMAATTRRRSSSRRSQQRSNASQGASTEPATGLPSEVRPPSQQDVAEVGSTVWEVFSTPRNGLFVGGLAALVAFSVIEWPVAAAIGVGTVVASSSRASASTESRRGSR